MSIDHLAHEIGLVFGRLANRYGAEWTLKWKDREPYAVIADWRSELQAFDGSRERISAIFDEAMRHLPERPVNAPAFRALCQQAREKLYRDAQARVHGTQGKPVRGPSAQEREQLAQLREQLASGTVFGRPSAEWAAAIVQRYERGEAVAFAALRIACEVVQAQERRRSSPPARRDAFDAHPSAMLADDEEVAP